MNSVTIKVGGFVGLTIWVAVGILYHLVTSDIPFTWSDPWLYVTIGLWPIFFLGWVILTIGAVLAILVGFWWYGVLADERKRKNSTPRKRMEEHRRKTTLPHHRK